jgi:hypothetical protein
MWSTAGWYNFECGLWDWVYVGEGDIHRALDFQLRLGAIEEDEREAMATYITEVSGRRREM